MEAVPSLEACRICANFYVTSGEVELLNLFEHIESMQNELEFITSELRSWQSNISCNDGLPQKICGNCFSKFCSIYAFRAECLEAQEKLLQAFVEGDCAEEIVTAQETAMNGVIPTEMQVENEEIVSLDSMLLGGGTTQIDQTVEFMPKPKEVNSANAISNTILELSSVKTTTTQTNIPETTHRDKLGIVKAEEITSDALCAIEEDLEEVLQGNYIPKALKRKVSTNTVQNSTGFYKNEEMCEPSEVSSFEEEDDPFQTDCTQNPLACQYCYATREQPVIFPSAESLSQHFFDEHDPTFPYTCPECPHKFNNSKGRLLHVKQKHMGQYQQTQRERLCQYCGKAIRGVTREEHMEHCQYLGDWECTECKLEFKQVTYFTYKAHVQREHAPGKKQLKCIDCGRVFAQRTLWENHRALHAKNTVLWCNKCKEAFADTYELRKHKYKMHKGELPVNCDYCNKGFVTYPFLNRHLQNFHPDKLDNKLDADMYCKNCGTEFTSMLKLRNHQQKPLDENGRCIVDSVALRKIGPRGRRINSKVPATEVIKPFHEVIRSPHDVIKSSHEVIKPSHEVIKPSHEVNKPPQKCEICTVMFRSTTELKQHMDLAHLQLKTFICEHCGKKFAYKKDLRDHMEYHEELNEPCPEAGCTYFCVNRKMLNDHMHQMHRLIPCEYCNQKLPREVLVAHMANVHNIEMTNDDPAGFIIKDAAEVDFNMNDDETNSFVIKDASDVDFNMANLHARPVPVDATFNVSNDNVVTDYAANNVADNAEHYVNNIAGDVVAEVVSVNLTDVSNLKSENSQEKVVVEFLGGRPTNDLILQDVQPAHQYPISDSSVYNPFEDYAAELIVEQEHEIVVT